MALIDSYKRRLAEYEAAESRILKTGQSTTDEDGRTFREGNLSHIQNEITRLRQSIFRMENPNLIRRSYPVE